MSPEYIDDFDPKKALDDIASEASDYDPDLEVWEPIEAKLPTTELQFYQTATTAFKTGRNPRTLRAAYHHATNTMYVVFYSGVYYMYMDVPPSVWANFKKSPSPGNFLWNEGFDSRGPSGALYDYQPVDMTTISKKTMEQLNANLKQAKIRQEGLKGTRTVKRLYPKGQRYKKPNRGGF